jgi:hypothetical protein
MHYDKDRMTTYLFRTRQGDQGIFQTSAAPDDPNSVKIRYKMLKKISGPPAEQPTVANTKRKAEAGATEARIVVRNPINQPIARQPQQ